MFYRNSPSNFMVVVGTNFRLSGGVSYGVQSFLMHPNYNTSNQENDIAIVIVKQDILFNTKTYGVALPSADISEGWSTLTGWGAMSVSTNETL